MNTNITTEKDEFLSKLIGKTTLENPSENFTTKLMEQIQQLPVSEAIEEKSLLNPLKWIFLTLLLIIGSIFFVLFDFSTLSFRDIVLDFSLIKNASVTINTLIHQVNTILAIFKHTSIIIPVLLAIPLLFGFDKLLKKPQTDKSYSIL